MTTAPEPSIELLFATSSMVIFISSWSPLNHGAEAPPGMYAFTFFLLRIPPPQVSTKSPNVLPISIS